MRRLLFALALAACSGTTEVSFPPGLEPLEDNVATLPPAEGADAHPEKLVVVTGPANPGGWANAKGFVHAPLATVVAALQKPEVLVDRRRVQEFTVTKGIDASFEFSFRVHNVSHDILTVEFDSEAREATVQGTKDAPEKYAVRMAKTAGTTFITDLEDSVVATRIDDATTELDLERNRNTAGSDETDAGQYVQDLFDSIAAAAHGKALPTYE